MVSFDTDMGLEQLETLVENSKFPWLLSNVLDADTSQPLLKNVQTKLIVEIDGLKVRHFSWPVALVIIVMQFVLT